MKEYKGTAPTPLPGGTHRFFSFKLIYFNCIGFYFLLPTEVPLVIEVLSFCVEPDSGLSIGYGPLGNQSGALESIP